MQHLSPRLAFVPLAALLAAPATSQGSTASLSSPRQGAAAVAVGDLAMFAGGRFGRTPSAAVDIYDRASGAWSTATLSVSRGDLAATAVGPYVLCMFCIRAQKYPSGLLSTPCSRRIIQ